MIAITGGTGYIGSNLSTYLSVKQINHIILDKNTMGKSKLENDYCKIFKVDLLDTKLVIDLLQKNNVSSVVHLAALKNVSQSLIHKRDYYVNNVLATRSLVESMKFCKIRKIIFSSTAAIYGQTELMNPVSENDQLNPQSFYAENKLENEIYLLQEKTNGHIDPTIFRFFNVVGNTNMIKQEDLSSNLFDAIIKKILNISPLVIYGDDFPTIDGFAIRDYLNMQDLLNALVYILINSTDTNIFNLGSGVGFSVLEVIKAFEKEIDQKISFEIQPKREGDVAFSVADVGLARRTIGWEPSRTLQDSVRSSLLGFTRQ